MTEIPEHLLKRSRERRAAITGDGGDDGGSDNAPAKSESAAPAQQAPAAPAGPQPRIEAPAPAAPEPPKPDIPVVAAYKRRKRIPGWAMLGLAFLPIWGFMYARAVTTQAEEATGPLALGEEEWSTCASCHGATGGGGNGYAFAEGAVLETFPHIEDQLRFVYHGTSAYQAAGVDLYGNPDREGGAHIAGEQGQMPAQGGNLSDDHILGVVCYERYEIGGADPEGEEYAEEFENWCSEESPVFTALEAGGSLLDLDPANFEFDMMPIGEPTEGSPPGE